MSQNINQLFANAVNDGAISPQAFQALNVNDIGAQIQAGLGVDVGTVQASEVVIVTLMPDDSGSIRFRGNSQVVRDGHNLVVDALSASKQKSGILIHNRYLNGKVLYPYTSIDNAIRMDSRNYDPNEGTPLYDETIVMLATVLAKNQEFSDTCVPCRSISLIISDGADEHSKRANASKCKTVITDMLSQENHIIAAMGIDDAPKECSACGKDLTGCSLSENSCPKCGRAFNRTDFRKVFSEMGIPDEWILTPGNSESEIRKAFHVFSQSAVRASQGGASFSQTAIGGFGA